MDRNGLLRLLPTMEVIAEEFPDCQASVRDPKQSYRGVRVYRREAGLQPDILYLVRQEDAQAFPGEGYGGICCAPLSGGNRIVCARETEAEILDRLLELFSRLREQELMLDALVYRGGSLEELCELGAELLGNPVYIHDDWFMMIARSAQIDEVMAPEYVMTSANGFVPRAIVDDFKYDSDYLETYSHRNAQVWNGDKGVPRCLYVNLWEGTVYRGRLLTIESNRTFRKGDFILAEVLTQRAMFLLRRKLSNAQSQGRSMDDVVYSLLQGGQPDSADLTQLLNMLSWGKSDQLVCIRIRNQQAGVTAVMEHMVHSDLFRSFPGSYILLTGHQQCVIVNLTRQKVELGMIRHQLAPLCRDYCLYAGISSPVAGIRDLHLAYFEANIALDRAFQLRSEKWIIAFSDCALDHLVNSMSGPLHPGHLVAPVLQVLLDHDRDQGTQYFETLRTYLLQERDIPRTAQALIIHRTTLLYRLKKIQSLISVDLDDPWKRLYLILSLWLLEREGSQADFLQN